MTMAIILQFNSRQGGIIADEASWHLARRKTLYGDPLSVLLSEERARETGIEAVYIGDGFPSFHYEAARKAFLALNHHRSEGCDLPPVSGLEDVARIAYNGFRDTLSRRVDDRLEYLFGFNRDDYSRGEIERAGRMVPIAQEAVKTAASAIINYEKKIDELKPIFENTAVVAGLDPQEGLAGYYLDRTGFSNALTSEFVTMGTGSVVASRYFATLFKERSLEERRRGMNLVEGVFHLISAAIEVADTYSRVGGDFHLMLLDADSPPGLRPCRLVESQRSRLALEVVRARHWDQLKERDTTDLVEALIGGESSLDVLEERMWKKARDRKILEFRLQGGKVRREGHL